ncbi:hypothetical protein AK812_SmicGene19570 [Symbiodinium microadriaticum]|uniref:Uncharacterized protein n=1 Tax=Symbiodinium microadriaticum TaxID=2951 RepID=A0A1Q9DS69_SYMMI|nr:hypothetical protein AK812_SmicGene19570 [Symbiodinium microadriaticum]
MTSSMRCLLFRMLSRGGSSVQHLVTDVHKGFPFQLFRCLAGPAAAAEVKDSRPCLRDPVAAWMLRNFPEPRDLCSDRAGLRHHVHRSEAQLQSSSAGPPECADLADGLCTSVGRLGCQAACAAQAEVFKRGARNREEENWPPGKDTLAQAWCGGPYRAFVHLNCKGKQLKLQGGWQRYTPTGVTQDGDLAFTIEDADDAAWAAEILQSFGGDEGCDALVCASVVADVLVVAQPALSCNKYQLLDTKLVRAILLKTLPSWATCLGTVRGSKTEMMQRIGFLTDISPSWSLPPRSVTAVENEVLQRKPGWMETLDVPTLGPVPSITKFFEKFFKSLLLADPAPATSSTLARISRASPLAFEVLSGRKHDQRLTRAYQRSPARPRFSLGQVTAGGKSDARAFWFLQLRPALDPHGHVMPNADKYYGWICKDKSRCAMRVTAGRTVQDPRPYIHGSWPRLSQLHQGCPGSCTAQNLFLHGSPEVEALIINLCERAENLERERRQFMAEEDEAREKYAEVQEAFLSGPLPVAVEPRKEHHEDDDDDADEDGDEDDDAI